MGMMVIGSCVTRDVFDALELPLPPGFQFYARMSFATMFGPKVPLRIRGINNWQDRMIGIEMDKSLPGLIGEKHPDIIVLDLVDERFDIWEIGDGRLNVGADFIAAGIGKVEVSKRIIPRLSEEAFVLWADGLHRFNELISAFSPRVFLHSARWASQYVENGETKAFPERVPLLSGLTAPISEHNALLDRCEAEFRRQFPKRQVIRVPEQHILADGHHRWNLAPFHYVPQYYREFVAEAKRSGLDFLAGALSDTE